MVTCQVVGTASSYKPWLLHMWDTEKPNGTTKVIFFSYQVDICWCKRECLPNEQTKTEESLRQSFACVLVRCKITDLLFRPTDVAASCRCSCVARDTWHDPTFCYSRVSACIYVHVCHRNNFTLTLGLVIFYIYQCYYSYCCTSSWPVSPIGLSDI